MPQKLSIFNLKVLHSFSIWPFPPLNWIHCGICGEKEAQLNAQIVNWTSNIESEPHHSFISLNIFIKQFSFSTLDCSKVGAGWGLVVALSDQSGSAEMRWGGKQFVCVHILHFQQSESEQSGSEFSQEFLLSCPLCVLCVNVTPIFTPLTLFLPSVLLIWPS